ncbi:hypothetical protein POG22_01195 [Geitlerinema sp. CS-897]|nr:hypothetical protein [Geitlerinema sp. CS-897]
MRRLPRYKDAGSTGIDRYIDCSGGKRYCQSDRVVDGVSLTGSLDVTGREWVNFLISE